MSKIYIYCNPELLQLARNYNIHPIEKSHVLLNEFYSPELIALYDLDKLNSIPDEKFEENEAWWREVGEMNTGLDDTTGMYGKRYKPKVMREVGLLTYICDGYGCSQPRNVAAVIGTMAKEEGKTPIEFFNSIKKLTT